MNFFQNPSRRRFLQSTTAAIASCLLPRALFARNPDRSFWFIHAHTGDSWPVADPVSWSLENAHEPILNRAAEGLRKLRPNDDDRIIRLVVRRCHLNLFKPHPGQVVVHHWASHRADLRPFFKAHGLARKEVEVVVWDRKQETIDIQMGDDFLFGDRLAADFPLDLYRSKWASRFKHQPDDWSAAPGSKSGFAWDGIEDNRIPWKALKSAWRRTSPMLCLNCDTPTILINFGNPWTGMLNRTPRFIHVCSKCRRSFKDESVKDVGGWIVANLDAEVRPGYEMVWGRRMRWEGKE